MLHFICYFLGYPQGQGSLVLSERNTVLKAIRSYDKSTFLWILEFWCHGNSHVHDILFWGLIFIFNGYEVTAAFNRVTFKDCQKHHSNPTFDFFFLILDI